MLEKNLAGLETFAIRGAISCRNEILRLNTKDFGPIAYRVGTEGNEDVLAVSVPSIYDWLTHNQRPFIIKIDIQGGEEHLFTESDQWVSEWPLIIIELHDWMLPFQNVSRNFYKRISSFEFDLVNSGENTFCFNRRLLGRA